MSIELAHDPVLSDTDILDCVAQTPFEPDSRTNYLVALGRAIEAKVLEKIAEREEPIRMIVHCPRCGKQHVDKSEVANVSTRLQGLAWDNPPHRSHLCGGCGCIWRPADVPTNGVAAISTKGKADNWTPPAAIGSAA